MKTQHEIPTDRTVEIDTMNTDDGGNENTAFFLDSQKTPTVAAEITKACQRIASTTVESAPDFTEETVGVIASELTGFHKRLFKRRSALVDFLQRVVDGIEDATKNSEKADQLTGERLSGVAQLTVDRHL